MSIIYNPVALIFMSYGIGAVVTGFINSAGGMRYFTGRNYLNDKWTERIGVLHFGWLVKNTFMRFFNQSVYLKNKRDEESMKTLIPEMTNAEVGHLIGFVTLLMFNIFIVFVGADVIYCIALLLINVVFNLYLVFLQQYNKRRIKRLLKIKIL